ncbi:hypothetical protein [Algibacter mikhailovii]|uniref:hypothetical protein n=1 Tax=Algibacter mikhailovii TaxID=425498 RepID=UPI002493DA9A|nr:hypothetical protein [Algibacter mikhailovii]
MKISKKRKGLIYKTIFILGILLMFWEIKIYRLTIIDFIVPLSIILIVGLITTPLALKDFQDLFSYSKKSSLYFWTFIQSTFSWGFIFCSIFMFSNYYLASTDIKTESYIINDRSSLPGRKYHRSERKPTFKIDYNGKEKELVFSHKYYSKMNFYKTVDLEIKKGFLGYDILITQKLK